jgi:hypothetical protein
MKTSDAGKTVPPGGIFAPPQPPGPGGGRETQDRVARDEFPVKEESLSELLGVGAFYLTLFGEQGPKLDAEVLATAFNAYAATQLLGGTTAQSYRFTVNAYSLGAYSWDIGSNVTAFGVANNTTLNVYQILLAANNKAVSGLFYCGDKTLRDQAINVFDAINEAGGL